MVDAIYVSQATCRVGIRHLTGEKTKSLVYSALTSGDKSLVAEIMVLKRMLNSPAKKALSALPCVALIQEKMK